MKFKFAARKKRKKIESVTPFNFFSENFKVILTLLSLIGYMFLLSYTWPLNFVPVVSAVSLPFVLLGMLVLLMFLWVFALLLWLPFDIWFFDKRDARLLLVFNDNQQWFEKVYFFSFCFASFLSWIIATLVFPVTTLIGVGLFIWASYHFSDHFFKFLGDSFWKVFLLTISPIFLFVTLLFMGSYIRLEHILNDFWLLVLMAIIYWWYSLILSGRQEIDKLFQKSTFFLLMMLMIPLFLWPTEGEQKVSPHPLVKAGLKIVHLGGGIPVKIISSSTKGLIRGELLFYDGHKAWVKECVLENETLRIGSDTAEALKKAEKDTKNNILITEVVVQKIKYLSEDMRCIAVNEINGNVQ